MSNRSAQVLASAIRLRRQQHAGAILVVEGRDDHLFLEKFTCQQTCKIIVGESKARICEAIAILEKNNFTGVLGVVDADFDRLGELPDRGSNIVMPEYHDLETMLLCSSALGEVLAEHGSQEKIARFGDSVLDALIQRALPIGCLRLYSLQNGLNLRFNGLTYSSWIEASNFSPSIDKLIAAIKNLSQRPELSDDFLARGIREIEAAKHDPLELCNGTDLVEILSVGLRRVLGNNSTTAISAAILRRSLRLAYPSQDFASSELGAAVRAWEALASEYPVLRRLTR